MRTSYKKLYTIFLHLLGMWIGVISVFYLFALPSLAAAGHDTSAATTLALVSLVYAVVLSVPSLTPAMVAEPSKPLHLVWAGLLAFVGVGFTALTTHFAFAYGIAGTVGAAFTLMTYLMVFASTMLALALCVTGQQDEAREAGLIPAE